MLIPLISHPVRFFHSLKHFQLLRKVLDFLLFWKLPHLLLLEHHHCIYFQQYFIVSRYNYTNPLSFICGQGKKLCTGSPVGCANITIHPTSINFLKTPLKPQGTLPTSRPAISRKYLLLQCSGSCMFSLKCSSLGIQTKYA